MNGLGAPSTMLRIVPLPRRRGRMRQCLANPPLRSGGGGPPEAVEGASTLVVRERAFA